MNKYEETSLKEDIKLVRNLTKSCGRTAQGVYDECCKLFGWDYNKRGRFGKQQRLFAENVTPQGYDVVFLPHSNFTKTQGGKWINTILKDTIEELWLRDLDKIKNDMDTRVVFAKNKYGYVFLGAYQLSSIDETFDDAGKQIFIRTFKRISDSYPFN